jgi:YHS domain-containing protein
MNNPQPTTHIDENNQGYTACGARIPITEETPFIYYRNKTIYFCGQDCKQLYDEDPLNSCMAAHLLSGN